MRHQPGSMSDAQDPFWMLRINIWTQSDAWDQKSDAYNQHQQFSWSHICMSQSTSAVFMITHVRVSCVPGTTPSCTFLHITVHMQGSCQHAPDACQPQLKVNFYMSSTYWHPRFHDQLGCRSESELVVNSSHKIKLLANLQSFIVHCLCKAPAPGTLAVLEAAQE